MKFSLCLCGEYCQHKKKIDTDCNLNGESLDTRKIASFMRDQFGHRIMCDFCKTAEATHLVESWYICRNCLEKQTLPKQ